PAYVRKLKTGKSSSPAALLRGRGNDRAGGHRPPRAEGPYAAGVRLHDQQFKENGLLRTSDGLSGAAGSRRAYGAPGRARAVDARPCVPVEGSGRTGAWAGRAAPTAPSQSPPGSRSTARGCRCRIWSAGPRVIDDGRAAPL